MIDHPLKLRKLHTTKISGYMVEHTDKVNNCNTDDCNSTG